MELFLEIFSWLKLMQSSLRRHHCARKDNLQELQFYKGLGNHGALSRDILLVETHAVLFKTPSLKSLF